MTNTPAHHPPTPAPARATPRSRAALVAGCLAILSVAALPAQAQPAQAGPPAPAARNAAADRACLNCHSQPHIAEMPPAERLSMVGTLLTADTPAPPAARPAETPAADAPATRPGLLVNMAALAASPHAVVNCTECHQDAAKLPHAAKLAPVNCTATCHAEPAKQYELSAHREAAQRKEALAPTCTTCHTGGHQILKVSDRKAAQHKLNSIYLCGDCHKKHSGGPGSSGTDVKVSDYLDSAHARAVTKSGLAMAATCVDCHGAHGVRPSKDPLSSVSHANIPKTCGACHIGVEEVYAQSVHGRKHAEANGKAAVCTDCHTAHQITMASAPGFLTDVIKECGRCHDSPDASGDRVGTYYKTYADSYHGQVTKLGGTRAARCSDCHGYHDIQPLKDPRSRVGPDNIVATCAKCHPGANASFVKFNPHANHRDSKNFPILHGVWLYFMIMMSAVFTFFGIHTLLWFARSMAERIRHGAPHAHTPAPTAIRRFSTVDRVNHIFVALTFFGLTATGIPLVFSQQPWALKLAALVGGVQAAGLWHRFFAVLLILNFAVHFIGLGFSFFRRTCSWQQWLFGPNSLLPRWKDAVDCFGMFRWFFGLGPRPRFDRWTYWEKFDYIAEVGGSVIIGGSGLLLWFPETASRVLPGWSFNVAMIVHGYEALLAIGFIFTIHFFNAHLRPGTFPVDEVIFTGSLPEHELKEQRPEEYERLVASGKLESLRVPAPDKARRPLILAIAIITVSIGLILLGLIIYGGLA